MAQRGRKSAAELSVVPDGEVAVEQRPNAPDHLTDDQARIWEEVVGSQPADWFGPENLPLLEAYCAHVVSLRSIDSQINQFSMEWAWTDDGVTQYDKLLKMRERESKAVSHFARSMRLTQQSQYNAQTASTQSKNSGGPKPWEN